MTDPIRKALVVRGGWPGHAPVEITDLFLPFLKDQGFTVEVSDTLDVYADAERLAATDLIVQCWTMGEITGEQSRGLADAVRAGTGFAGWHGGIIDSFRGDVDYVRLTGGQFLMHPPGFVDYTVGLGPVEHPITAGLADFAVHTEHYWVATDPANEVLAASVFPAGGDRPQDVVMPQVWTRAYGAGRVFVSAIGHKADDFDVPEVRAITERGLLWASR
ncbi:ThuA domain-containing protein [Streptomyces sp. NBC_01198]|uniref:ThuA domain-containing protein n=1 Tax=Streptomyces sp. NBC_01198 TaxID=2903769 RepID=UPI002E0D17B5|nr:ThuA domain-containing protein [Streptomyces sp. NBC_01198]